MDDQLRRAERDFFSGDPEAEERFIRACARMGIRIRNHKRDEILTEWEEIQQIYDDQWWHGNTARKCGLWGRRNFGDVDFKSAVFKAHHDWVHWGWNNRNAKRKTLRTHRDGSRSNYKIKDSRSE